MKLLLHACCGPCSLEPVRLLHEAGHDLTIYYANSNIAPDAEYSRRLDALLAWAKEEDVAVMKGLRAPCAWEASAGRIGEEALSEARERLAASSDGARPLPLAIDPARRMERCRACYRLRFEETALAAAAHGFDGIGTTLSVSPVPVHRDHSRRAFERRRTLRRKRGVSRLSSLLRRSHAQKPRGGHVSSKLLRLSFLSSRSGGRTIRTESRTRSRPGSRSRSACGRTGGC